MFEYSPIPHHCHNCGRLLPRVEAGCICSPHAPPQEKRILYGIREDNGEHARWLVKFQLGNINLLQFDDLDQGTRMVVFDDEASAAHQIMSDPSLTGAVIVRCEIVNDKLVIHS